MAANSNKNSLGVDVIEQALDVIISAADAPDLCRRLVHASFTGPSVQGAHIYLLDNTSCLQKIASYGETGDLPESDVSIWTESPLANAVREKQLGFGPLEETNDGPVLYCVPWISGDAPLGCLVLVMRPGTQTKPFEDQNVPLLGKLGAIYAQNTGLTTAGIKARANSGNGEDLTSRQLAILNYMADGMVNAEIAQKLMLSESSIRQETVRIYRALGVANRLEASKKGRALGLVTTRQLPPPPRNIE